MPLSAKYEKIKRAMIEKYGKEKGEQVFYAWCNKQGIDPHKKSIFKMASEPQLFFTDEIAISEVEVKGEKKYYVTGYISTSDLDSVNDIVTSECLSDMVKQLKNRAIKIDVEHEAYRKDPTIIPMGKIVEAKLDERGIWVKAELNKHSSRFEEIWKSIKDGFLDAFSITFKPLPNGFVEREINGVKTRMLNAIKLLNVALTGNPANEAATMTGAFTKSLESIKEDDKMKNDEEEQPNEEEEVDTSEAAKSAEEVEIIEKKDTSALTEAITALKAEIAEIKEVVGKLTEKKENEDLEEEVKNLTGEIKAIKEALKKPVTKATVPDEIKERVIAVKGGDNSLLSMVK